VEGIKSRLARMTNLKTAWMIRTWSKVQVEQPSILSSTNQTNFQATSRERRQVRAVWLTIQALKANHRRRKLTLGKLIFMLIFTLHFSLVDYIIYCKFLILINYFEFIRKLGTSGRMGHKSKPSQQMNSSANLGVAGSSANDPQQKKVYKFPLNNQKGSNSANNSQSRDPNEGQSQKTMPGNYGSQSA
jgi:hypothetical protein